MDRRVLPSRLVQDAIKSFVAVRVDAWKELDVVEEYQVPSTPAYAVLAPTGELLVRAGGYLAPEDFVAFLRAGRAALNVP